MLQTLISLPLIFQAQPCLKQVSFIAPSPNCLYAALPKSRSKKPKNTNESKTKSRYQPMGNGISLDNNSIQKVDAISINYTLIKEEKSETGILTHLWKWTVYCPSKVGNITQYSIFENGNLKEEISGNYNLRSVSLGNGESNFRRFGEYSEEEKTYRQSIYQSLKPLPIFSKALQYVCSKHS